MKPKKTTKIKSSFKHVEQKTKVSLTNTYHPLTDESKEEDNEESKRRNISLENAR